MKHDQYMLSASTHMHIYTYIHTHTAVSGGGLYCAGASSTVSLQGSTTFTENSAGTSGAHVAHADTCAMASDGTTGRLA